MANANTRRKHERWLMELTSLPTASGREDRVVAWLERWVRARRNLVLSRDRAGNLYVRLRPRARSGARSVRRPAPLVITAHLDHPAFVVSRAGQRDVELEFRGTVHDPYFEDARIEILGADTRTHGARIVALDPTASPFKRATARLDEGAGPVAAGDIGRWAFPGDEPLPRIVEGRLHTAACDDLAGVAAAIAAMDVVRARRGMGHVGLLFTRAEEVGFIGAIAACKARAIPKRARLLCLETSRSFPESPIGGGPIVRVGDRTSVFEPTLTNAISLLMTEYEKAKPGFAWQRRLMPGGTCEATTFSAYGYRSTCLCVPLGNYHNMVDIDGVAAGARPARVGPEYISMSDFHGLVEMLVVCAAGLDAGSRSSLRSRMEGLFTSYGHVLKTVTPS